MRFTRWRYPKRNESGLALFNVKQTDDPPFFTPAAQAESGGYEKKSRFSKLFTIALTRL
jgi:hypothetical protein